VAGGFYLGKIWMRFYYELNPINLASKAAGEWLRDKPGSLWVSGLDTAVYVYAGKRPACGMADQMEIRDVATERKALFVKRWRENPPDWVVVGDLSGKT
jgi:hypothetical protein